MLSYNPVYHFDKLYSKSVQHSLGKNVKEMINQSLHLIHSVQISFIENNSKDPNRQQGTEKAIC